jgi:hypothetical protein
LPRAGGSPGRSGSSKRLSPGSPSAAAAALLKGAPGSSILFGAVADSAAGGPEALKAAYPSARGLVRDTVDPRLRSSRATKER